MMYCYETFDFLPKMSRKNRFLKFFDFPSKEITCHIYPKNIFHADTSSSARTRSHIRRILQYTMLFDCSILRLDLSEELDDRARRRIADDRKSPHRARDLTSCRGTEPLL